MDGKILRSEPQQYFIHYVSRVFSNRYITHDRKISSPICTLSSFLRCFLEHKYGTTKWWHYTFFYWNRLQKNCAMLWNMYSEHSHFSEREIFLRFEKKRFAFRSIGTRKMSSSFVVSCYNSNAVHALSLGGLYALLGLSNKLYSFKKDFK